MLPDGTSSNCSPHAVGVAVGVPGVPVVVLVVVAVVVAGVPVTGMLVLVSVALDEAMAVEVAVEVT